MMIEGIKFLILALLTVYFSIKISVYADSIERKTKLSGLLIGGLILASITSFPELITSVSAVIINNYNLAIGDILESCVFNILIISVLDIFFLRYFLFQKLSKKGFYLIVIIILNYIVLLSTFSNIISDFYHISIVSIFIIFSYIAFVVLLSHIKMEKTNDISNIEKNDKYLYLKFILTSIIMIMLSIFLTIQANVIASQNIVFSSSTIGAFLLGITTSLPEVVSTLALIRMKSYNLAFANIIGSNAFNFFILSICDLIVSGQTLYVFKDQDSFLFIIFGIIMHIILLLSILRKKCISTFTYALPSILLIISYIYLFYLQFS